jgi:ParB-like chromosome segregation protein Spo0J
MTDAEQPQQRAAPVHITKIQSGGKMQAHPLADLLPPMSDLEYAELRDSIRDNGLRQPITLHRDGRILDGRNRARVCDELGRPVASVVFKGTDGEALAFVLDLNLTRRHLNESQRAMIAADLATMRQGARTDIASIEAMSQAEASERVNVSRTSTQRAVLVRDNAIPEIAAAVRQGYMPVSQAVWRSYPFPGNSKLLLKCTTASR